MGEVVRYNNDMNLVQFNKFKDKELDLFFSICYKLKEQGTDEISLDFAELKKLSKHTRKDRMVKDLKNTYDKLLALNFEIKNSEISFIKFVLFTKYEVLGESGIVKIAVNKEFKYILNELGTTYTKFELEQFVSLRSIYSKNLFKILKQWETKKEKEFEIEEFRRILNIPDSYNLSKINEKVLKPILKELSSFFFNFKLEKIKQGRKISKLKFTWAAKKIKQTKLLNIEIIISKKLEKTIEKANKNKFVNPILTKENIKKLLEIFDEKILINAFNKAYTEIKKEINFNYLKTFIENTLRQQEIKFTVVNDIEDIEPIEEKKQEFRSKTKESRKKITVTKEEKKQKYKEYLKINNLKDDKFNRKGFEITFKKNFELLDIPDFLENIKNFRNGETLKLQITLEELNQMSFDDMKGKSFEIISKEQAKKNRLIVIKKDQMTREIIELSDIEENKLLSKTGKKLFGGALIARLEKIAKDKRQSIKYKDRIITF